LLYGVDTQGEAIAAAKARRIASGKASIKRRYHEDPAFRNQKLTHKKMQAKVRRAKSYLSAQLYTTISGQEPKSHGGLMLILHARQKARLSEPLYNYWKKLVHRTHKRESYKKPDKLPTWRGKMLDLKRRIKRIEQIIAHETKKAERLMAMPWIEQGYRSLHAWVASGDPIAVEYRRLRWQEATHRRRSLEAGASITVIEWRECMADWAYRCAYCNRHRREFRDAERRMDIEMDHVVPLSNGGRHIAGNIVPACKSCNSSKGNSDVLQWMARLRLTISDKLMSVYEINRIDRKEAM